MGSRLPAFASLLIATAMVVVLATAPPASVSASVMCPPFTIQDYADSLTTTTTTTTSTSTSTTTPSTTVPDTTVPDTTVPDTTVPDTTVPDTTVPDTTVPDTTVPDTTVTTVPTTTTTTAPPCDTPFTYPMVFPVLGGGVIGSPFGAPRDGGRRLHHGVDIAAPQLQPIVAVADGTVTRIGPDEGISGYRVFIRHDDGWATLYIHLNNDTAGTDDGLGTGIRPDLAEGDRVEAGQVIGWNGNSGNAEGTEWHLHFELHDPDGNPVDPDPSLRAVQGGGQPALGGEFEPFVGPLVDVPWHRSDSGEVSPLVLLLSRGFPVWCDPWAVRGCPDEPVLSSDLVTWLSPLLGGNTEAETTPSDCDLECLVRSLTPLVCNDPDDCAALPPTEADLVRLFAWDALRRDYDRRLAAFESDPERRPSPEAWAPPPGPDQLTTAQSYVTLHRLGICVPFPEADEPLTRAEAGQWLVERLLAETDQCSSTGLVRPPKR